MTTSIDLAALLCSRLCHDLLSPVGALGNGLELLADEQDDEMRKRCIELLEQSALVSANKLKFFRLAFGAAGGFADNIAAHEAHELVLGLLCANDRVELQWAVAEDVLPKPAVKVLLNLASIGGEALIRGGILAVGAELRDGGTEIVVRATGNRVAFDPVIGQALEGSLPVEELTSRTAPAYMISQLTHELGGQIQYMVGEDTLLIGAVLPNSASAADIG